VRQASGLVLAFLLLGLLCLGLFLPGISHVPPIDRDESRFAQASRQMLDSGDYIRIQFQNESRAKKPAGIYWLQAAVAGLSGARQAIWPYRLPSVAGALIAVLLTAGLGRRLVGTAAAFSAAALLASCFLLVSEAHQAKTDAVQLAAVVAAQGVLAQFYLARPAGLALVLLFWLAQGIGILVKGPIVPLISLLTAATLAVADRRAAWLVGLRPLLGLPLVALLVGPWLWAINRATNGQFIGQAVQNDLLSKVFGVQESHGGPPGTYLLLLVATNWPASLFVIPALPYALARRRQPIIRFLLAWIIPVWLLFEAIPTKLPHYILPVYPALALLAALWLWDPERPQLAPLTKIFALTWGLIGTLAASTVLAAPLALGMAPIWTLVPLALPIAGLGWLPAGLLLRRRPRAALGAAVLAALVTYGIVFQLLLPRLEPLWISRRIATLVPLAAPLAAAGYHEPSLVFLHGRATLLTDGAGAADFLLANPDGWSAVESAAGPAFRARLAEAGRTATSSGEVDGFNYSRGRAAMITLWRIGSD